MEPPQLCQSVWQQWKVCTPRASLLFAPHFFFTLHIYYIFMQFALSRNIFEINFNQVRTDHAERNLRNKIVRRWGPGSEEGLLNPILHDLGNSAAFFTVSTLRQDDLLLRSTCWWRWVWNVFAVILTGKNRSTRRKSCSIAILSTTNLTYRGMGSNPSFRCEYENIQSKHNCLFLTKITYILRLKQSHLQAD